MKGTLPQILKEPPSKEDVYRRLVVLFRYTPSQIADMNLFQQLAIVGMKKEEIDNIKFDRVEDYLAWKQEEGFE